MTDTRKSHLPNRFQRPSILKFMLYVIFLAFFVWAIKGSEFSIKDLFEGVPHMIRVVNEMSPPDFNRIKQIGAAILETFQMALVGAVFGVGFSFVVATFAARNTSPHVSLYYAARFLISFCRTVPNLVWAILFVASVGLGAFAGTLTIIVDTVGFCGRFFAEAMEEVDSEPQDALSAMGAGYLGIIFAVVVPAAMPSFTNSALFSLEKAVRSSVVLGLVGAGGVGIELKVAMDMFQYREAATIMLCIFVMVIVVEQISTRIRRKLM